ncbi:unnamed protein product [Periconia digitata]|uniref:Uncharacterized protein n=1 Tax=Periconia digitata TaxID=1303443 RepID=A0A9W4UGU0_9PLEO|nr:unnamed protein product [Periconia digitata]
MQEAVRRGKTSQEEMLQTLDEMLFANLDVTIGGISWNLMHLADHPGIQRDTRRKYHSKVVHSEEGSCSKYMQSTSTLLAACILEFAWLRPHSAGLGDTRCRPALLWWLTHANLTCRVRSGALTARVTGQSGSLSTRPRSFDIATGALGLARARVWGGIWSLCVC